MHESTQRRWLLCGFLSICIAPTLWTVGWIVSHRLNYRTSRFARLVSQETGLDVRIGRVSYPRPRQILLHDVSAFDAETDQLLATARMIEWFQVPGGAVIVASQPTIHVTHMKDLWELLHHRCLRRRWPEGKRFDVYANELTLRTKGWSQTISLLAQCENRRAGPFMDVRFHLAGDAKSQPIQLRLTRRRTGDTPVTIAQVQCPQPISCALLGPHLDLPRHLGAGAKFQGSFTAIDQQGSWRLQLRDVTLSEVDLNQLVQRLPYKLSGIATIHCSQADLGPDKLNATFSVKAGPGQVGVPLLRSLARNLNCPLDTRVTAGEQTHFRFTKVGIQVELVQTDEAESLEIRGACEGTEAGVLVADDLGPLLTAPVVQPRPIDLVTALLPQSATQLPAVAESIPFLRLLRLPSSLESSRDPGAHPRAKVKFISAEEDVRE